MRIQVFQIQLFWFFITIVTVLAHLSYLLYLKNSSGNVFDILFYVSTVSNGIWIHLAFILIAFTALDFLISLFKVDKLLLSLCNHRVQRLNIFVQAFCPISVANFLNASPFGAMLRKIFDGKFQLGFSLIFVTLLVVIQWYSSGRIIVKKLNLTLHKGEANPDPFEVAVITDLHVGASVYKHHLEEVVNQVNSLNVDAIFLIGVFLAIFHSKTS